MFHLIYMKEFYKIGIKNAKINFLTKILWTKEHWFFERKKKKKEHFFHDISKKNILIPIILDLDSKSLDVWQSKKSIAIFKTF